ncbi:MAG: FAD-dependent oxidoreductase [Candidatus Thermoplasmatota archaeon]
MKNYNVDVAVVGGGPAGLAAAVSAKKQGLDNVVILERNTWLGGILPQCIHDGFGVEETGESLTGPEYAWKYIRKVRDEEISIMLETMVLEITNRREIIAMNKNGIYKIMPKAIVLAMGCREKTRWHAMIPGDRVSGIYTAGVAQAFINLYNIMPGENVVILGSGDVGLIMARQLHFEGATVKGVIEILPYASGLPRNVVQCLDDYDIPLYLRHTVTNIKGKGRLQSVTIAEVDSSMQVKQGTEQIITCDTLLLSLGLIPENEVSKDAGIKIDMSTGGPIVDQCFETSFPGVFACGNCLQVYDTVDVLSKGAKKAGGHAGKFCLNDLGEKDINVRVKAGEGINYVVPQKITKYGLVDFTFRVESPGENTVFYLKSKEKTFFKKSLRWVNPANMVNISIEITKDLIGDSKELEVSLHG